MKTITISFLSILLIISLVALVWSIYQLVRNEAVFKIRKKWINNLDDRWYQYSNEQMYKPSRKNIFGLIFPNEKQFPKTKTNNP